MSEPNAKTTPGDVFRQLLTIFALYLSAVSFGRLLFGYIDRWLPDPLITHSTGAASSLRWAIATLVIVFPVYVWFSWMLARDAARYPEKRNLRIRKWLYHFTVFAAAAIIIGDLVALLYNFLSGELTVRFILKVASVLFIAVSVFTYYLWNLKREEMASHDPRMRWFVWGIAGAVTIAAIGGFFLVGSPFAERARRFDDRRVSDLQAVQWQIVNYWQRKDALPPNLDALTDSLSGFVPPRDPETGGAYVYRPSGKLSFELCASFRDASRAEEPVARPMFSPESGLDSWQHEAGYACFARTIDPDLYGIEKPVRAR